MWDRMLFRQWAAEQNGGLGPRSGRWACRLTVQQSAEAAVASGVRESDLSILAILGRRPVPGSATVERGSCRGLRAGPRTVLSSFRLPVSFRRSPALHSLGGALPGVLQLDEDSPDAARDACDGSRRCKPRVKRGGNRRLARLGSLGFPNQPSAKAGRETHRGICCVSLAAKCANDTVDGGPDDRCPDGGSDQPIAAHLRQQREHPKNNRQLYPARARPKSQHGAHLWRHPSICPTQGRLWSSIQQFCCTMIWS